jgi:hypothetical protein
MLYTVGLIDIYEGAISAGNAIKLGPRVDAQGRRHAGGWVWRTPEEAQAYLTSSGGSDGRTLYGVMAEWELDTMTVAGEPTRCLTRDALVVRIGPKPPK